MWNNQDRPHASSPGAKGAPETRQLSLLEDFEKAIRTTGPAGTPLEAEVTPASQHDPASTQSGANARTPLTKTEVEQEAALGSNKYLLSVPCKLITPMMSTPGQLRILRHSIQVWGWAKKIQMQCHQPRLPPRL